MIFVPSGRVRQLGLLEDLGLLNGFEDQSADPQNPADSLHGRLKRTIPSHDVGLQGGPPSSTDRSLADRSLTHCPLGDYW